MPREPYRAAKLFKDHHHDLIEDLKDPREASAYLNAALEAGDQAAFLLALRNVLEAHGGMTRIARKTRMNRVSLYKMLSNEGNPEFSNILRLLQAAGVRFSVNPADSPKDKNEAA